MEGKQRILFYFREMKIWKNFQISNEENEDRAKSFVRAIEKRMLG